MNEKNENAKEALNYINEIYTGKLDELNAVNKKTYLMLGLNCILFLSAILVLNNYLIMNKAMFLELMLGIVFLSASIVLLIVSLWDNKKTQYSDKLDKNLFDNNDLTIFFREQINNKKMEFIMIDKMISKRKSLLFVSSISVFVYIISIIAILITTVYTLMV